MTPSATVAAARAVSRAHLVPDQDFVGVVHSVFAHACNIAVGDRLLTVHDAAAAHTPTSIRAAGPGRSRWSPAVRAGAPVRCRAGVLSVGDHALDLAGIPVWVPPSRPAPVAGIERRLEELARSHRIEPAAAAMAPGLRSAVDRVQELLASPHLEVPDLVAATERLIGAGPGLTPSGDDVLVGVLAGLVRGGGDGPAVALATTIGQAAVARGSSTTDVSRHYLTLAAEGHFGQPLTELVDAVIGGASLPQLQHRVRAVLAVGASSGADALLGVVIGLSTVLQRCTTELQPISQEKAA